jgi:hypothetical protein
VEKCGKGCSDIALNEERGVRVMMRACSACAGDYEDPDRTALTTTEENDEEEEDALRAEMEEFPAAE